MTWRVRVWCRSCSEDNDSYGCFGGDTEVLDEKFTSKEAAEDFAAKYTSGPPWDFEVFEEAT